MLPSIMHMIRAPTKLSIRYSPGQCVQVTEGNNTGQCAMFPFLTNRQDCEILCSIGELCCYYYYYYYYICHFDSE